MEDNNKDEVDIMDEDYDDEEIVMLSNKSNTKSIASSSEDSLSSLLMGEKSSL
jgi:hypothetical protein